jgi:predicted esterase
MLGLAAMLDVDDVTYLAPQAANQTWYPYSFLAPIDRNEPDLSSGLGVLARLVETVGSQGVPPDRVVLLGFSQGACLTLELAARHARRYAAIIGVSGGLIGPDGSPRDYKGSLDGTPVFLGCSDVDPHVPVKRVHETRDVMLGLGGLVDERIYPGMPHTINDDEIEAIRALIAPRSS